jgi:hypothetical protein
MRTLVKKENGLTYLMQTLPQLLQQPIKLVLNGPILLHQAVPQYLMVKLRKML